MSEAVTPDDLRSITGALQDQVDASRNADIHHAPPRELREIFQQGFLNTDAGRQVWAWMQHQFSGETLILSEQQRHEHNIIQRMKHIMGYGTTLEDMRAQTNAAAAVAQERGYTEYYESQEAKDE